MASFHEYLAARLAPRTVATYNQTIRRLERWCWDRRILPDQLQTLDVISWADTLPATYATRNNARKALRHWLIYLEQTEPLHEAIYVPTRPRYECRAIPTEDVVQLRDTAILHGGRQGLAVLIGLYLGARRAEIAAMRWDGYHDGRMRWVRVKTGDPADVKTHPTLADALDELRPRASSLYLFPGDNGRPHVSPTTVWEWVRHVGALAGVEVSTHILRHICLATANDETGDLRAVQELAGHRDPAVTSLYTRAKRGRVDAAVDALSY